MVIGSDCKIPWNVRSLISNEGGVFTAENKQGKNYHTLGIRLLKSFPCSFYFYLPFFSYRMIEGNDKINKHMYSFLQVGMKMEVVSCPQTLRVLQFVLLSNCRGSAPHRHLSRRGTLVNLIHGGRMSSQAFGAEAGGPVHWLSG